MSIGTGIFLSTLLWALCGFKITIVKCNVPHITKSKEITDDK